MIIFLVSCLCTQVKHFAGYCLHVNCYFLPYVHRYHFLFFMLLFASMTLPSQVFLMYLQLMAVHFNHISSFNLIYVNLIFILTCYSFQKLLSLIPTQKILKAFRNINYFIFIIIYFMFKLNILISLYCINIYYKFFQQ